MYKVFINEHLITLTNKTTKSKDSSTFSLKTVDIEEVIKKLQNNKIKKAFLYHEKKKELIPLLKKKLPLVVAAGGVALNKKNKVLFIFRNGKWDLPKGKLDKGETIEEAAVREVEEETGVTKLKISSFLTVTYHIFKRNGIYKLKETHWYLMRTKYDGKLSPQCDEGITEVAWKGTNKIKKALKNSYHNIKSVVEVYEKIISES